MHRTQKFLRFFSASTPRTVVLLVLTLVISIASSSFFTTQTPSFQKISSNPVRNLNSVEAPSPTVTVSVQPSPTSIPELSQPSPTSGYASPIATPTATPATPPAGTTRNLQNAVVALDIVLPGISANAAFGDNPLPHHPVRSFDVSLFDSSNTKVVAQQAMLTFNGTSYTGIAPFSNIPETSYIIKVKSDNSLYKAVPGARKLISDQTNATPQLTLITGNIDDVNDSENILDVSDYNAILSCFDNKSCDTALKQKADLNDDGKVDSKDFNILLRGFATRSEN